MSRGGKDVAETRQVGKVAVAEGERANIRASGALGRA